MLAIYEIILLPFKILLYIILKVSTSLRILYKNGCNIDLFPFSGKLKCTTVQVLGKQ